MNPNLFIVGAPKCGTTAWCHYLRSHPEIFFSPLKEPTFFATDFSELRPVKNGDEYISLFDDSENANIIGEASARYLLSNDAAKNIAAFNPDARILIFLREQDTYLPSLHNQLLLTGEETIADFAEAWRISGHRDFSRVPPHLRQPWILNYKAVGRFREQVERFLAVFPEDRVRVFHFNDWSRDPRAIYLEIMRFLGLADDGRVRFPIVNEAKSPRSRWLAKIIAEQPLPVRAARKSLKFLLGQRASWRLSKQLSRLNAKEGYRTVVSQSLRDEIHAYYAAENARLEPRIWRPR